MSEIREIKDETTALLQESLPEGYTFVHPTIFWGKAYLWAVDKGLRHRLFPWPKGVTLDV